MSAKEIDIVKGDGKFELLAQLADCARALSWNKRQPFKLRLEGAKGGFDDETDRAELRVSAEITTLITGVDSVGIGGDAWQFRGIILDETIKELPNLKTFGNFEAYYDTRTRKGYIKPQSV